jgi:hypothetical protein
MKEAGKQFLYLVVAAIIAVIMFVYCSPDTYEVGDRFTVRRGGKIEFIYLEGDPMSPIYLRAVGSSYFRLVPVDEQELVQLSANPSYTTPLGYYQEDYFSISDFVDMEGVWKVDDGKGRIEVQFDDMNEARQIQIKYERPLRHQILVSLAAIFGFVLFMFVVDENF